MVRCPKCDSTWKLGAKRCPLCGAPLDLEERPSERRRAEPLIDPLLDLFDQTEIVHFCPQCGNETQSKRAGCRPCGLPLLSDDRVVYAEGLIEPPIEVFGTRLAAGPEKTPKDLMLVGVASSFEEAEAWLREFRFLSLEVWPGSDSLDALDRQGQLALFVRSPDQLAARYVIEHVRAADPLDRPSAPPPPPRDQALFRSGKWRSFGKLREAARELEPYLQDASVLPRFLELRLASGRHREVEERAQLALKEPLSREAHAHLLEVAGLGAALAPDGRPFGKGAKVDLASDRLGQATRLTPRSLRRGKMWCELLRVQRADSKLRTELDRLRRLNTNFLAADGPFRAEWDRLRLGPKTD